MDGQVVRKATIDDIEAIVNLWKLFHEEALYQICGIGFDRETVIHNVTGMVKTPIIVSLVAEENSKVIGTIIGGLLPTAWNKNYIFAMEAIWYVEKSYRGDSIGSQLLKEFERISKEKGATHIVMGHMEYLDGKTRKPVLEDKDWITTGEYYKKQGYKIMEQQYIREVR